MWQPIHQIRVYRSASHLQEEYDWGHHDPAGHGTCSLSRYCQIGIKNDWPNRASFTPGRNLKLRPPLPPQCQGRIAKILHLLIFGPRAGHVTQWQGRPSYLTGLHCVPCFWNQKYDRTGARLFLLRYPNETPESAFSTFGYADLDALLPHAYLQFFSGPLVWIRE